MRTAEDEGWGHISNGELIKIAEEANYQIMLTCNQNIQYQQNLPDRRISMVVLGSNIWPAIQPKIAEIIAAVQSASPGSFEFIDIAPLPKKRRLRIPPSDLE